MDSLAQVSRLRDAAGKNPKSWLILEIYREGIRYWRRWTVILASFIAVESVIFGWFWWEALR